MWITLCLTKNRRKLLVQVFLQGKLMGNEPLVWLIRVLSFAILILTLYATVNIFQSIWFRFYGSRNMSDWEKREFHVKNKYDVKWSFSMTIVLLLGSVLSQFIGLQGQVWLELLCAFLFWFLFWGNYRTLTMLKNFLNKEKERLKRKKDFDT